MKTFVAWLAAIAFALTPVAAPALSTYPTLVMSMSPFAYYRCNDASSSTTIADSSGNAYNMALVSGSAFTFQQPSLLGIADSTAHSCESPTTAYYDTTAATSAATTITYAIWAKFPAGTTPHAVMDLRMQTMAETFFDVNGQWSWSYYDSSAAWAGQACSGVAIPSNVDVFLVAEVVRGGSTATCSSSINGSALSSPVTSASLSTQSNGVIMLGISADSGGTYYGNGSFYQEFAIFPSALTQAQITNLYNTGMGTNNAIDPLFFGSPGLR